MSTMYVAQWVATFGNPSGMNYKLQHITYSSPFTFHSYVLYLISDAAIKSFISHVYTVYSSINTVSQN
jgi:hypothetical protein